MILNTNTTNPPTTPASPVSPLHRPTTVQSVTLVAASDSMIAVDIVSILTSNPEVRSWTFQRDGEPVNCSWNFCEIVRNNTARVFQGTIVAEDQQREARIVVLPDQEALDATVLPDGAIELNAQIVGAGCRYSTEHALLRLLTTVFATEQKLQSNSIQAVLAPAA